MPGSTHFFPKGTMCDVHPEKPAIARIQGETDSMGAELIDCCRECAEKVRSQAELHTNGKCQWCGLFKQRLRKYRDMDEGLAGPLYDVCEECIATSRQYHDPEDDGPGEQPTDFVEI